MKKAGFVTGDKNSNAGVGMEVRLGVGSKTLVGLEFVSYITLNVVFAFQWV